MGDPIVKGWCPGALKPMQSGDGLLVRIRPFKSRLNAEQLAGIGKLAREYGNGLVDFSRRSNLQLRGVLPENHAPLMARLQSLNLIDDNVFVESRRNMVVTPFWTDGDDSDVIAARLEKVLLDENLHLIGLPGKFGFAVDCGPSPVLSGMPADIRIERAAQGGLIVRPDGSDFGISVQLETAVDMAVSLARWFSDLKEIKAGRGRMRQYVHLLQENAEFKLSEARAEATVTPAVGWAQTGFLAGLELGQLTAAGLIALSEKVDAVRLTPWRMLCLEHYSADAGSLDAIDGMITNPDSPFMRITACTGLPACPQGWLDTRKLARDLSTSLPLGDSLYISGCTKKCAGQSEAFKHAMIAAQSGVTVHNKIRNAPSSGEHFSHEEFKEKTTMHIKGDTFFFKESQ
ncbi:precorrin-3B synthase [Sneathiella sp.]|jgi:precorrin-3B synthase|uniref:precorrin-3B synthase n=1 Tax=Sneathiella sp. TaxID=1964365 RepID=UPI0039E3DDEE